MQICKYGKVEQFTANTYGSHPVKLCKPYSNQ